MRARSLSDRYFFCSNCFSSSKIWRPVNVVRAFFFLSLACSAELAPGVPVTASMWGVGLDDGWRWWWWWWCSPSVDADRCPSSLSPSCSLRAAAAAATVEFSPAPDVATQIHVDAFILSILLTYTCILICHIHVIGLGVWLAMWYASISQARV